MYVSCASCHYDSGDCDNHDDLVRKVDADGGFMVMMFDDAGRPDGWRIRCPQDCDERYIHMD